MGEWVKMVYLRDPLVRFLSAFISKCVRHEDGPKSCPSRYGNLWDQTRDELNFTDFARHFGHSNGLNYHWWQQIDYCGGLQKTIGAYDFVHLVGEREDFKKSFLEELIPMFPAKTQADF